jgi:GTPase SAR1 family protein
MYFNGAAAAFIVYDITDAMSFEKAEKWVEDLDKTNTDD